MPFPSPGDLPNPGIEPVSPALAGGFFTTEPLEKPKLLLQASFKTIFFLTDTQENHHLMGWGFDRKLIHGYSLLDDSEIAKEKNCHGSFNV